MTGRGGTDYLMPFVLPGLHVPNLSYGAVAIQACSRSRQPNVSLQLRSAMLSR